MNTPPRHVTLNDLQAEEKRLVAEFAESKRRIAAECARVSLIEGPLNQKSEERKALMGTIARAEFKVQIFKEWAAEYKTRVVACALGVSAPGSERHPDGFSYLLRDFPHLAEAEKFGAIVETHLESLRAQLATLTSEMRAYSETHHLAHILPEDLK